jgi:hypothetical protein
MERSKRTKITGLVGLFFLMILVSCKQKNEEQGISPSKVSFDQYVKTIQNNQFWEKAYAGDTLAYNEIKNIYFDSGQYKEFLYYAMIMSEKNNFSQAYYDTYFILKTDSMTEDNNKSNILANFYLLKAYENNSDEAKRAINQRFEKDMIPHAKSYWEANAKKLDK